MPLLTNLPLLSRATLSLRSGVLRSFSPPSSSELSISASKMSPAATNFCKRASYHHESNQIKTANIYIVPYITSDSEALRLGLDWIGYFKQFSLIKHAILELARQLWVRLFQTRWAFILKARLPSDSLQNGIVNKSSSNSVDYRLVCWLKFNDTFNTIQVISCL